MMRAIRVELFDRNLDKQCMEQDRIWRATAHGISMPAHRRAILAVKKNVSLLVQQDFV